MHKINLTKFKQWEERNLHRAVQRHPYISKRVGQTILEVGLPPLEHLQNFNSMYIHGESGTGKTVMAVRYMLGQIAFQHACGSILTAGFIGVPNLLLEFRATFGRDPVETESQVLERYASLGLLVLDDFGTQVTTDWSYQMLYMLVNRRYDDMKPMYITSNFSLTELADKMGDDRITSRLYEICDIIENKKQYRHR
jgi:DNA replication protein DnaC